MACVSRRQKWKRDNWELNFNIVSNYWLYIFCRVCLSVSVCMSVDCPAGFTYLSSVNGGCYKVVNENLDWNAAGLRCRSLHRDAHLLVINDAVEQSAVAGMLSSIDSRCHISCSFAFLISESLAVILICKMSSSSCSPVNPMVTMRLKYDVSTLVCHVRCPSLPSCSVVNDSSPLVLSAAPKFL